MIDTGDTAFMILCSGLVLLMTIPGLSLYYSGMVRVKNVLASVMQSFSIVCLITLLWLIMGYSLSLSPSTAEEAQSSPVIGNMDQAWLIRLQIDSVHQLAPNIPESVYCMYQLTFAIITCALICGSFADRMRYAPMLVFMGLWHLLVYCPIAHSVWHPDGFLFKAGVLDFAGGNVVHVSSGIAGLVSTIVVGNRHGFGSEVFKPHSILLTFIGASLLWVGWIGFNAGSALTAGFRAGMALLNTQICTAAASISWMLLEASVRKQSSVLGMLSGAVSGLVAITPACGFVEPTGAFVIGIIAGPACYFGARLKHSFGYDDALDAFGVHAIGGAVGGLLLAFFASSEMGGVNGIFHGGSAFLLAIQLYGIVACAAWSGLASYILLKTVDVVLGLRVSSEGEEVGLDETLHGETCGGTQAERVAVVQTATPSEAALEAELA